MFSQKVCSLLSLSDDIRERIERGELDLALRAIHDFVERIITEPLCTSKVYGARVLDSLCQEIGRRAFEGSALASGAAESRRAKRGYAYIVTKLQDSGGHTHVIRDFIQARPKARHVVFSTELAGRSDTSHLMRGVGKDADVRFETAPRTSFLGRLRWLQRRLVETRAERTYLFNHHQDSVAVAAIRPEMGLDASYYHHGDHHLCLGVFVSHLQHIDPHPMGYHNCRDVLGIRNSYIPLTVGDGGSRPASMGFMAEGGLTTCTAARSNKIEIPYFVSYLDVIPELLSRTGGRHVHIGRLTPWALFRIGRGLKRRGVSKDRFVYMPWVASVWRALHQYRVDLYVASFPYGGGLTLIEAMGAGVPVALHRHMDSRVLSGIDMAYPEAFSWRYPDDLLDYCSALTREDLEAGSRSARMQYENYHRREVLVDMLDGRMTDDCLPLKLKDDFLPEIDEWAAWAERQLSCRRVVQRAAYRLVRSIRRRFF